MNKIEIIKTESGWQVSLDNDTRHVTQFSDVLDIVCLFNESLTVRTKKPSPNLRMSKKLPVVDV